MQSSRAHAGMRGIYGEIDFDDLNFDKREYDPAVAYAQSKLANVLHALDLARRLEETGISAFSVLSVTSSSILHTPSSSLSFSASSLSFEGISNSSILLHIIVNP